MELLKDYLLKKFYGKFCENYSQSLHFVVCLTTLSAPIKSFKISTKKNIPLSHDSGIKGDISVLEYFQYLALLINRPSSYL